MIQLAQLTEMGLDMVLTLIIALLTLTANAFLALLFLQLRQLTNRINIQNGRIGKMETRQSDSEIGSANNLRGHVESFHSK